MQVLQQVSAHPPARVNPQVQAQVLPQQIVQAVILVMAALEMVAQVKVEQQHLVQVRVHLPHQQMLQPAQHQHQIL